MDVPLTRSGMEIIPRKECLRLLAGRHVGRLGFLIGDQPMVLPVNYGISGDVVVFRSGEGTKIDAAVCRKVAFEVDDVDEAAGEGWSVVVQGVAEDITDAGDWFAESLRVVARPTWLPAAAGRYVRITPTLVTGRRIPSAPAVPGV
jgi:nitroimidazol reductase NimA-like FMN-containing flavoprotein (pyridoxamine 5'-phosphate oxidase superfamily)